MFGRFNAAVRIDIEKLHVELVEIGNAKTWTVFSIKSSGVDDRQFAEASDQTVMRVAVDDELKLRGIDQLPQSQIGVQRQRIVERPNAGHIVCAKSVTKQHSPGDGFKMQPHRQLIQERPIHCSEIKSRLSVRQSAHFVFQQPAFVIAAHGDNVELPQQFNRAMRIARAVHYVADGAYQIQRLRSKKFQRGGQSNVFAMNVAQHADSF